MATPSLTAPGFSDRTISAIDHGARDLANSIYRLTSSNRYLPSEENPALTLATQLQANAASFRAGFKNSTEASSLLAVASSSLTQIRDRLASARTSAAAAQSDALSDAERIYLQTSLEGDLAAADDTALATRFNNSQLLTGNLSADDGGASLTFAIGTGADAVISVDIRDATSARLLPGGTPSLFTSGDADDAVDTLDAALELLDTEIAKVGAGTSRVNYAADALSSQIYGEESAASQLSNTDITEESMRYRLAYLSQRAAYAVLAQSRHLNGGLLGLLNFSTPAAPTPSAFKPITTNQQA